MKIVKVEAKADNPLANEKITNVQIKTDFRPIRSAKIPNTKAPTAIPIELTLPIHPICAVVKFQSFASAAITNYKIPTSSASNSQPIPATPSNLLRETDCTFTACLIIIHASMCLYTCKLTCKYNYTQKYIL